MKTHPISLRLILLIFALLILTGCSGPGPPVDLSEIPIPPGLSIYEGPEETPFDTLILAAEQAFASRSVQTEIQYYWMPETVTWEQIEAFYRSAFLDSDWETDLTSFNTVRRTRNSISGEQVLVISAIPLSSGNGHILLLMLVSA